jgi:hypothetical protein
MCRAEIPRSGVRACHPPSQEHSKKPQKRCTFGPQPSIQDRRGRTWHPGHEEVAAAADCHVVAARGAGNVGEAALVVGGAGDAGGNDPAGNIGGAMLEGAMLEKQPPVAGRGGNGRRGDPAGRCSHRYESGIVFLLSRHTRQPSHGAASALCRQPSPAQHPQSTKTGGRQEVPRLFRAHGKSAALLTALHSPSIAQQKHSPAPAQESTSTSPAPAQHNK